MKSVLHLMQDIGRKVLIFWIECNQIPYIDNGLWYKAYTSIPSRCQQMWWREKTWWIVGSRSIRAPLLLTVSLVRWTGML